MDDEDLQLATLLRAHAERMTDGLTDASVAYEGVSRRGRVRRSRRTALVGGLAAAAAVAGVLALAAVTGEQATVRTPATSPTVPATTGPPTSATTTLPATTLPGTTVPATTLPATTVAPTTAPTTVPAVLPAVPATVTATTIPVVPAPPPTASPTSASPATTTTYDGIGGSITVRLSGGTLTLVGAPSPAPGYTTRVDDNGPDRVRVRFERDDARTEIRVDVEGGEPVPEIIED